MTKKTFAAIAAIGVCVFVVASWAGAGGGSGTGPGGGGNCTSPGGTCNASSFNTSGNENVGGIIDAGWLIVANDTHLRGPALADAGLRVFGLTTTETLHAKGPLIADAGAMFGYPGNPGEMVEVVGNVLINSSAEQALIIRRSGAIGSQTAPKFHLGRIIAGGISYPEFRFLYQDDAVAEHPTLIVEGTGTVATVLNGTAQSPKTRRSMFEGYIVEGDIAPVFRISAAPNGETNKVGISFGPDGGTDNDVYMYREETGHAMSTGIVDGGALWPVLKVLSTGTVQVTQSPAVTDYTSNAIGSSLWQTFHDQPNIAIRRTANCTPAGAISTALTCVSMTSPTVNGTASASATIDTSRMFINYLTATADNAVAGLEGSAGNFPTKNSWLPKISTVMRTDTAIATTRLWFGLTDSTLSSITSTAGLNSAKMCGLRFDTGIPDTDWMACSSDGTTATCTDTGVVVATGTTYSLIVDASVLGACDFYINNTTITPTVHKTSNVSGATGISWQPSLTITALDGNPTPGNILIAKFGMEQN